MPESYYSIRVQENEQQQSKMVAQNLGWTSCILIKAKPDYSKSWSETIYDISGNKKLFTHTHCQRFSKYVVLVFQALEKYRIL